MEPHKRIKTSVSDAMMIMDARIWKELPEDLLQALIARLPIATLFRFRSVCRRWNSLLDSPSFSTTCLSLQVQAQPWFYVNIHHTEIAALYDPCTKKWNSCSVPKSSLHLPVASAGGLVCCFDRSVLRVGNPLTRAWKELRRPRSGMLFVGMVLNQDYSASRGYKLVCVDRGECEVYDSLKDVWCPKPIPAEITVPWEYRCTPMHTLSVANVVYFLRSNPDGIVSYDVESEAWEQRLIPNPPYTRGESLRLVERGGRILLVGLGSDAAGVCVCVWELEKAELNWVEVERMPSSWCSEFDGWGTYTRLHCFGDRGLLMMSVYDMWMKRVFTYDVMSREWSNVTQSVLPGSYYQRMMGHGGVAFFPSLVASP